MIFAHLIQAVSSLPTDPSALESSISALESAISALESAIKTLEMQSVPWEQSLPWLAALVAIGVAMEFWVVWHDRCDELEEWAIWYFIGIVRSPARPPMRKFVVEMLSVFLVTAGIVAEVWVGIKIASINGTLRGKSAELRSKNAELRGKSDLLLALVNKEAFDAKERAANIELRVADRHITFQQRQEMVAILRPQAGTGVLVEYVTPSGTDAPEYAIEIGGVFHDAGWKVTPSLGRLITMNPPLHGFAVEGGDKESRVAKKALRVLDRRVHTTPPTPSPETGQMRKTGVVIYVGSK